MQWIDIKERLPNRGEWVLVWAGEVYIAYLSLDGKTWYMRSRVFDVKLDVTHWQVLPDGP